MIDNETALARRAVACPRWRWMYGMLASVPPAHSGATGYHIRIVDETDCRDCRMDNALPVLTDPATLGCLLHLVRQVKEKPHLFCSYRQEGFWAVADHDEFLSDFYHTEAEAWIEVLEEALP